ncbi:alpha/beta fold hydrolase [Peredibacter starrii]|uniref:Alpha/beta hydrolase n=1 Tax=Peredibacter starrii TaxID=28202 RepID=A0AAX4HJW1_9BACT|nr:alpha/beta hydrolase [Peredibacter starrii]WPU63520.1 alpha/beta hydrolase [Peredibacter starrii]
MKIENEKWKVNGIELNVAQYGPKDGPPVILLHGFPENSKAIIEAFKDLAEKSLHIIAPDQRGYGVSDKPKEIKNYSLEILTKDMEELIQNMGLKDVTLVGHDWGGMVAWFLTNRRPDLVKKLIVINSPHYEIFKRNFLMNPVQLLKSSYIFLFLIPKLPEIVLNWDNFAVFKFFLHRSAHPKTDQLQEAWKQEGAITSMLNWYRAMIYNLRLPSRNIQVPTLLVWGEDDVFLQKEMALQSLHYCNDGKVKFIKNAGHWVHHQRIEEIIGEL